jgi:hypothetical protein
VYDGNAYQATLLADYWSQIVGCDAPGQDRIAGAWGKEVRSPFMHKRLMQFALNLPPEFKQGKPLRNVLYKKPKRRASGKRLKLQLVKLFLILHCWLISLLNNYHNNYLLPLPLLVLLPPLLKLLRFALLHKKLLLV